jgi:FdhD protein
MAKSVTPVGEVVYRIVVNGRVAATLGASPDAGPELAAGWLLYRGYIDAADVAPPVVPLDDARGAAVSLPPLVVDGVDEVEAHRREAGCGLLHWVRCDARVLGGRTGTVPLPTAAAAANLLRGLFEFSDRYHESGGVHSAATVAGGALDDVYEDVSRHCAVDRALGAALLAGKDLTQLGVITTARISGEMALKAARAGVGWLASRSVPTTLAVEIAAAAGTPLIARAAGGDPRVFVNGSGSPLNGPGRDG